MRGYLSRLPVDHTVAHGVAAAPQTAA